MTDPKYKSLHLAGNLSASSKMLYTLLNNQQIQKAWTELDLIKKQTEELSGFMNQIEKQTKNEK